jgi:Protein of unknown function (DUF4239)
MSEWFADLPVVWMAFLVFGLTYFVAASIYAVVVALATGERARAFKAVSPGMLPPLGILFALFVAFTASEVWGNIERANTAVDREASAAKSVLVLAASFPGEPEARLRGLIHRYIEKAVAEEWPSMGHQSSGLSVTPPPLAEALTAILALSPHSPGQEIAQRALVDAISNVFDARRQRIIVSRSHVGLVKWACLFVQAISVLIAIAMVHIDNRRTIAIAMGLFTSGVAASFLLIFAYDRPFTGELSISPTPLIQVEIASGQQ